MGKPLTYSMTKYGRPPSLVPASCTCAMCVVETCMGQLSSVLGGYDILVDCTANETVQDFLMREAIRIGGYYCRVQSYQGGSVGEVIHSIDLEVL